MRGMRGLRGVFVSCDVCEGMSHLLHGSRDVCVSRRDKDRCCEEVLFDGGDGGVGGEFLKSAGGVWAEGEGEEVRGWEEVL